MPDAKGICPGCFQPVIAKCGSQRIHHWAHQNRKNCDSWWEPETEWHRAWKNQFPIDWQEIVMRDEQTTEIHIADVCTIHNNVIEFQHSPIHPNERISRERFFRNLIWIVDGIRLKFDFTRFLKEKRQFILLKPGIFQYDYIDECFPPIWTESPVPVIFDYRGISIADNAPERASLYCLFPKRIRRSAVIAELSQKAFIKVVTDGEWLSRFQNFTKIIELTERDLLLHLSQMHNNLSQPGKMRSRRRL